MAKLKNYEAFPKGLSGYGVRMQSAPKKPMSKRGRRAQRQDIMQTAVPLGIAAALAFLLYKKSPKALPEGALTTNP